MTLEKMKMAEGTNIEEMLVEYVDKCNVLSETNAKLEVDNKIINTIYTIPIKRQIDDFIELGFKNIIVCQDDKTNNMYNIENYRKYLQENFYSKSFG